jgi:septal ring factor EnvC (AmiA/AmiB activator)
MPGTSEGLHKAWETRRYNKERLRRMQARLHKIEAREAADAEAAERQASAHRLRLAVAPELTVQDRVFLYTWAVEVALAAGEAARLRSLIQE